MLIDLLRHGETDRPGALLGRTDYGLSASGWRQFERQTAQRDWEAVVTSPLRCAREPAERLARERNCTVRIDPNWAELDFGAWDGCALADLNADSANAARLQTLYSDPTGPGAPEGESWQTLVGRVNDALAPLAGDRTTVRALVVTHTGPMRAALALACDIPFERLWALKIDYAARITLRVEAAAEQRLWGEIVEIAQP